MRWPNAGLGLHLLRGLPILMCRTHLSSSKWEGLEIAANVPFWLGRKQCRPHRLVCSIQVLGSLRWPRLSNVRCSAFLTLSAMGGAMETLVKDKSL